MMGEDNGDFPSPALLAATPKSAGRKDFIEIKDRIEIFESYTKWLHQGGSKVDSPITGIMRNFKVNRNYPCKILVRCRQHGSIQDHGHVEGRQCVGSPARGPLVHEKHPPGSDGPMPPRSRGTTGAGCWSSWWARSRRCQRT